VPIQAPTGYLLSVTATRSNAFSKVVREDTSGWAGAFAFSKLYSARVGGETRPANMEKEEEGKDGKEDNNPWRMMR